MRSVSALQFKLGCTTPEPITSECQEFFQWLAHAVVGEPCSPAADSPRDFVPISNRAIGDSVQSDVVYHEFWKAFEKAQGSSRVFLVDVDSVPGVFRAHLWFHLAQAVNGAISKMQAAGTGKMDCVFVLILPELPPPSESSYLILAQNVEAGRVVIFSHDGDYAPAALHLDGYSQEQFAVKFATSRGEPYKMLEKKMVCRLGHFKRHRRDGKVLCARHFYDGRFCDSEIVSLLETMIRETYGATPQIRLVYHRGISSWLVDPVLAVGNRMEVPCIDFDGATPGEPQPKQGDRKTLLVVDFVSTGGTLCRIIDQLGPEIQDYENLDIVAVLCTNPTGPEERVRELDYKGRKFRIRYFMRAEQQVYLEGNCPLCALGIPESQWDSEPYRMLTTYNHWDMCIQAGLKPEDNTPEYRTALPYVVDYPKIMTMYGAWFTSKVRDILTLLPGGFPADAVIVCPERETGSQVFTDYLKMLLNVTVIRVPREVINSFAPFDHQSSKALAIIQQEMPSWYRSLVSTAQVDVIIMDEFNASGQTLEGLRNIVSQLGKGVLCFFLLNDLNPAWSERQDIPVYALYRWQSYPTLPAEAER